MNKLIKAKNQDEKQLLTNKIGRNCPFSSDIVNKKSLTKQSICENCGKLFKTNNNSNYCLECKEIFYDEP
jgi:hypothetical protein